MLRFSEIGLFLVPFALFVAWRVMGTRLPRAMVWSAMTLIVALAVGSVWFGLDNRLGRREVYVPAHVEDGRIVPGHGVPPS